MTEKLSNKTKFYIAPISAGATTLAAYQELTWTEIGNVFDLGEFGDMAEAVESKRVGDSRLRRYKGTRDGGQLDLIVNRDPTDAGQIMLVTAAGEDFDRPFKIVMPDRLAPAGKDSEIYFQAAVLGGRVNMGEADNIVRTTWSLAINTDKLETAPTAS